MTPRTLSRTRRLVAVGSVVIFGASFAACGGDDDDDAAPAAGSVAVSGAWARTSPAMASAGAVYMTLTNEGEGDDALVGASVDAAVAAKVELHETSMAAGEMTEGSDAMTTEAMGGTDAPMMQMSPVDSITIPKGGEAVLEPGGYHIMLLDLAEPLELGSTIEVTLEFADAPDQTIEVEVRDAAP